MFTTVGRVLTGLTPASLGGGVLIHKADSTVRLNSVRQLALSLQRSARLKKPTDANNEEVNDKPIKFSTSKASHKTWKVDRSMGSNFQRPWWKVLPISLFGTAFLLWCALRGNTDIDKQLDTELHEHLPNLPPSNELKTQNKSE